MSAPPVRVLLADDDPLVRTGLRMMLGGAGDIEVVAEVSDGGEVADAVARTAPHVVLMDVRMPVLDGIAATRALTSGAGTSGDAPVPAVVVLTTFDAGETVLAALRAGAAGFLVKHTPPAEIVDAVRRAAAGDPVLSPVVTRRLMTMVAREPGTSSRTAAAVRRFEQLSDRERDVAAAVADGLTNAEIADRLHLSVSSVKAVLSSATTRLDLTNRVQLAILAYEAGRETTGGGA
ncbi:response regulator transcription factor [Pseudonocardia sediminis]|uniref:response regulator transcription factor n=1 Tax=Pseudonocardia sediminis TaxID=1397368 RepID=UPI0030FE32E0